MRIHMQPPIDDASRIVALVRQRVAGGASRTRRWLDGDRTRPGAGRLRRDRLPQRERCSTASAAMKAIFAFSVGVGHLFVAAEPAARRSVDPARGCGNGGCRWFATCSRRRLRFAQRLDVYARQQRDHAWRQLAPRAPREIEVGVLGLGVIGSAIAQALAAQGFRGRAASRARRRSSPASMRFGDATARRIPRAASTSWSAFLPLTAQTCAASSIAGRWRCLRDGAHVINIGRGAHLVEADLLALLGGRQARRRNARCLPRRAARRRITRSGRDPRSRSRRTSPA